jgi:hypothetical protein
MTTLTTYGYRIVEIKNGKIYSLFHGIDGSREIPVNQWNVAEKKMVRDGSGKTYYESSWHFLPTYDECEKMFASKFRIHEGRIIVKCLLRGNIRIKPTKGTKSCLADEIYIEAPNGIIKEYRP